MPNDFEQLCSQCNTNIRGLNEEDLMLNIKRHLYKRHPVIYSLAQGYSEIKNGTLVPVKNDE